MPIGMRVQDWEWTSLRVAIAIVRMRPHFLENAFAIGVIDDDM